MNTSTTPVKKIEMDNPQPSFQSIQYRTIIAHTVTYFVTGIVASILLGYATRMIRPDVAPIIRNITDPILVASPLFQPFRAALLAIVFYLFRDVLFSNRKGWLIMWCMLVVLGILTPFSASWGGIEGMIFFQFTLVGSYSRLAGGLFTDIVIISHSYILGKSPQEQTSPCHLVGGFRFDNVVADNLFIIENLDSQMVVHTVLYAITGYWKGKLFLLLMITINSQEAPNHRLPAVGYPLAGVPFFRRDSF